ncbi:hypothetical protein PRZ48_001911 [Zasmidium cellare]|uniref:Cytochrome P450 n=1 Tax=Zasmidium cellare TaxID=395010 RepID=A0ABR0F3X5_ZASCE|nr:hypothetical protein PRZ48_001911 [Zasmidium cellare]
MVNIDEAHPALWVAGVLVLCGALFHVSQQARNLPNGPFSLPLVGTLALFRERKMFHIRLRDWAYQYGDFFHFKIGRSPVFVLSSPKAINDLLIKQGSVYSSRPRLSNQASLITQNSRIVALPYDDQWRKQRKLYHDLLGMQNSKIFMPFQGFESRQSLLNLLDHPGDFWKEVTRYSASVTFGMLLRCRFESSEAMIPRKLQARMGLMFKNISPGRWLVDWIPILDRLPDALAPWRRKAIQLREQIMPFFAVFYHRIKEQVERGEAPECFLASILQEKGANLRPEEPPHIIATTMAAGTDTTATTLQHFVKAAVLYPDVMREAQREIDSVVGRDRLPNWEDRSSLLYIAAMITETHRWASAVPIAFPHATSRQDKYRDSIIPSGATVIGNVYAIHNDPKVFLKPDEFMPERYLPKTDPRAAPDAAHMDSHYSYGFGRRECPGRHVADASLFIVISRMLWAFDFVGNPEKPPGPGHSGGPVYGPARFEATARPRDGNVAPLIRAEAEANRPEGVEDSAVYEKLVAGMP